jgi:hypothetical protein
MFFNIFFATNLNLEYPLKEYEEILPLIRRTPFVCLFASFKRLDHNSDSAKTNTLGLSVLKYLRTTCLKSKGTKNILSASVNFSLATLMPVFVRVEK